MTTDDSKRPAPTNPTNPLRAGRDHADALLDEALGETFPASDPIAISFQKTRGPDGGGATPRTGPTVATAAAGEPLAARAAPAEATIYAGQAALVETLLAAARNLLVTIAGDAPLIETARHLRAGTDLVVVCGPDGVLAGVITKTDVVARISECGGAGCVTAASSVMVRDVFLCRLGDRLQDVWSAMKERRLKNVPIIDVQGRPVGVLNARDALQVLLQEVKNEESLLRDYVMGVGYR